MAISHRCHFWWQTTPRQLAGGKLRGQTFTYTAADRKYCKFLVKSNPNIIYNRLRYFMAMNSGEQNGCRNRLSRDVTPAYDISETQHKPHNMTMAGKRLQVLLDQMSFYISTVRKSSVHRWRHDQTTSTQTFDACKHDSVVIPRK